jgi:N-methylhydantoinase B/oxoprolinase/acetone carboxylase alpha subunit
VRAGARAMTRGPLKSKSAQHSDIPLNQGCLNGVTVRIPPSAQRHGPVLHWIDGAHPPRALGTLLNPSDGAAVVGGNVLTSQRVTDVVLKAFRACAASQGARRADLHFRKQLERTVRQAV